MDDINAGYERLAELQVQLLHLVLNVHINSVGDRYYWIVIVSTLLFFLPMF